MSLRPSSIARAIACPASVVLSENIAESSSDYADLGTAAHTLGEMCLRTGLDPEDFRGDPIDVYGQVFEVDSDMIEAVEVYVNHVDSIDEMYVESVETSLEVRLESESLGFGGTIDTLKLTGDRTWAHIVDYKHGAGVYVPAAGNQQLKAYAALVIDNYPDVTGVKADIVQPRVFKGEKIERTFFTREEIDEFRRTVDVTKNNVQECQKNKDILKVHLKTGSQCQFCPAKKTCPKIVSESVETIESDFDSVEDLSADRLLWLYERRKQTNDFLELVSQEIKRRLKTGESVGELKVVRALGNRRYALDESEVEKKLRRKKFKKAEITETRLLSPAKLEKIVGKEILSQFLYRPETGLTIVPSTDKREAVSQTSAIQDFSGR